MTSHTLIEALQAVAAALADVSSSAAHYEALDDSALLDVARMAGAQRDAAELTLSLAAAVIARRSSAELGHAGLAQRLGHRTPHELLRVTTRSTERDARTAVRVGALLDETQPWAQPLASALRSGELPATSAEAIANGLGEPSADVDAATLRVATEALCHDAQVLDADRLFARARDLRAELDADLVVDREQARRSARSLRIHIQPDGMTRLVWLLDPESAAVAVELFDRATSPRRGGPRFVDAGAGEKASRIAADDRTTAQLASDTFLELLRQGASVDTAHLLGSGAPSVRVVVREESLASGRGSARIEGQSAIVSVATAERLACSGDTVAIVVDASGQPLDVGREQRQYTRRQRIALAVRDTGCRWPGCGRPPSWTEAHHIHHWARDGGRTDVADGILLCRHHHLLVHNNGWEITRDGAEYWLIPPREVDAAEVPVPMPAPDSLAAQPGSPFTGQGGSLLGPPVTAQPGSPLVSPPPPPRALGDSWTEPPDSPMPLQPDSPPSSGTPDSAPLSEALDSLPCSEAPAPRLAP